MRVLLVKTSSMGDIIHTFPALTDAGKAIPGVRFDWAIEAPFSAIPSWHPLVDQTIPVELRKWRKGIFSKKTYQGLRALRKTFHSQSYDLVLDAQGLVKSALVTWCAPGKRVGLDWRSARESLASLAYQRKYKVNFYQHAVHRMRSLFALALGYDLPNTEPDFGLDKAAFPSLISSDNYFVFLHGTTWTSKQWPAPYWIRLANMAGVAGYRVKMGGGNDAEVESARQIAAASPYVDVMPQLSITETACLLAGAKGVVSVDTGFGHLAAALDVRTVSIYGSTNPDFTGALGKQSVLLAARFPCSPCLNRVCTFQGVSSVTPACYETVLPSRVFEALFVEK